MTQTLKASEFKARCLQVMDDVAASGERVVITKRNRPLVALVPAVEPPAGSPFGWHRGEVAILGDIIEPADANDWEALR